METGSANKDNKVVLGVGRAGQGFVSMPKIQLIPTLGFMYWVLLLFYFVFVVVFLSCVFLVFPLVPSRSPRA